MRKGGASWHADTTAKRRKSEFWRHAPVFLEKGYTNTRVAEVLKAADVSASTFQNIFRTKDGVLTEFVRIMFGSQFGAAKQMAVNAPSPAHVYAAETALQLALTEMNENLRDVYLEAYTYPETMEIICRRTAMELQAAFSAYLPEYTESDFYETDLGTGGMMRGFMARRCDQYFTLEKKIRRFFGNEPAGVPGSGREAEQIQDYAAALDVRSAAKQVMDALFASLSMTFDLSENHHEN